MDFLVVAAVAVLLPLHAVWAAPLVRVGSLAFGTPGWQLDSIKRHGDDTAAGIELQVHAMPTPLAAQLALQAGAVDVIAGDWLWVAHQRAEGRAFQFVAQTTALGSVLARPDAGIRTLGDLRGKPIGVAGSALDKNWLLLRAWARREYQLDLLAASKPQYGAPPLLNELSLRGELPVVLDFWQYGARLQAQGYVTVVELADVVNALAGTRTPPSMMGWIFPESFAQRSPQQLKAFLAAARSANARLASDDQEWEALRPLLRAEDEATFQHLRAAYRAGIPAGDATPSPDAAARLWAALSSEGGNELGGPRQLDPRTFWRGEGAAP